MTDLSQSQASSGRVGAGIKLAALVFTLGAIALAADLAWLAPGPMPSRDSTREMPVKYEPGERIRYPEPATPPGAQPEPHVQAF